MSRDDIPTDVIAAQFAGGMTIARLAREWELEEGQVETAVRHELRLLIPRWAGGLMPTREQARRERQKKERDGAQELFEADDDDD